MWIAFVVPLAVLLLALLLQWLEAAVLAEFDRPHPHHLSDLVKPGPAGRPAQLSRAPHRPDVRPVRAKNRRRGRATQTTA